jgi:cyclophilin family peptidyl-prolyl cis-trans isomerase
MDWGPKYRNWLPQVTEGMDIVNKIGKVKCDGNDCPVKPVQMISVTVA